MQRQPYTATPRTLLAAFLLLLVVTMPAAADSMDEALAAFDAEDYTEAARLLRPLAESGHPRAQFYLGSLYFDGRGVPQDHALEAQWIRRSAERGFNWAQNMLGRMYTIGRGVEQDDIEAHMWFDLAAAQGTQTAYKARQRLAERMTEAQIEEARKRASEWEPVE